MVLGKSFDLFGADHCWAVAITAGLAAGLIGLARRHPGRPVVRWAAYAFALLQLLGSLLWYGHLVAEGTFDPAKNLPFHLCDTALLLAIIALIRPRTALVELVYLWGLAGTLQGLITPLVQQGFPDLYFLYFFLVHGGIVVSALFLVFGLGLRPRQGVLRRAFGWLVVHAAVSGTVDLLARRVFDVPANYLFLCEAPAGTLLTQLGPWPWYLLAVLPLAWVFFQILLIPVRLTGGLAPAPERRGRRPTPTA